MIVVSNLFIQLNNINNIIVNIVLIVKNISIGICF